MGKEEAVCLLEARFPSVIMATNQGGCEVLGRRQGCPRQARGSHVWRSGCFTSSISFSICEMGWWTKISQV